MRVSLSLFLSSPPLLSLAIITSNSIAEDHQSSWNLCILDAFSLLLRVVDWFYAFQYLNCWIWCTFGGTRFGARGVESSRESLHLLNLVLRIADYRSRIDCVRLFWLRSEDLGGIWIDGEHSGARAVPVAEAMGGLHIPAMHYPIPVSIWQSQPGHSHWASLDQRLPQVDSWIQVKVKQFCLICCFNSVTVFRWWGRDFIVMELLPHTTWAQAQDCKFGGQGSKLIWALTCA